MLLQIMISFVTLIPILISIAFFTLAERKVIAAIQRRRGPNVVGIWGMLQPFADGLKLILKEIIVPSEAYRFLFILAPIMTFILSLTNWAFLPFSYVHIISNMNLGLLFIFAISSFSVYGIVIAGWASQSRYPFLGAMRSASQMISYEVALGIIFVIITLCSNSLNFIEIVGMQDDTLWFIFPLFPIATIFFITILAETNRHPFDLPEAESELVAGYCVEYSSILFALFFLAEYNSIIVMSTVMALLFLGGWSPLFAVSIFGKVKSIWLSLKTILICFFFILVRAAFPRYRYDQLMDLGWKVFLPFTLSYLIFVATVLLINL